MVQLFAIRVPTTSKEYRSVIFLRYKNSMETRVSQTNSP